MNEVQELLADRPDLKQALTRSMMLYDAAEVLSDVQPPHASTAADYLRAVANTIIRDAGLAEEFLQAIIKTRPPTPWEK